MISIREEITIASPLWTGVLSADRHPALLRHDSPLEQRGFELAVPPRPARGATTFELHPGNAQETSGVEQVQLCRFLFRMGPRVRILLPPAVSQVRTRPHDFGDLPPLLRFR